MQDRERDLRIKVDVREPKKTFNILDRQKVAYEKVLLKTGDLVCEEKSICIERKHISDFAASIIDGRLWSQIERMKKEFKHSYILISGRLSEIYWSGLRVPIKTRTAQVLGAMASVVSRHKIPVLCLDNDTQLLNVAIKIIEKGEFLEKPKAL